MFSTLFIIVLNSWKRGIKCTCKETLHKSRTLVLINFFVRHCDVMLKHNYFTSRWLDVLDVVIEKVKGCMTSKLRTMQLIEADLQLLVIMFLGTRIEENYENNKII